MLGFKFSFEGSCVVTAGSSTIIASQVPIGKWHTYFDEPTIADAILDHIIPKVHRIELKGKSLRTKSKHVS
jgi:DNA replication protein